MNKTELLDVLVKKAGVSKVVAAKVLDSLLTAIGDSLSKGDDVTLIGFGSFTVSKRQARNGRNPRTGATIKIPATKVPHFKAGKLLRSRVAK